VKLVLKLVRPRYFTPIHGEFRQLTKHARLAEHLRASGLEETFIMESGDVLEIDHHGARCAERLLALQGHLKSLRDEIDRKLGQVSGRVNVSNHPPLHPVIGNASFWFWRAANLGRSRLLGGQSRLKAGCGQNCPPSKGKRTHYPAIGPRPYNDEWRDSFTRIRCWLVDVPESNPAVNLRLGPQGWQVTAFRVDESDIDRLPSAGGITTEAFQPSSFPRPRLCGELDYDADPSDVASIPL